MEVYLDVLRVIMIWVLLAMVLWPFVLRWHSSMDRIEAFLCALALAIVPLLLLAVVLSWTGYEAR